MINSERYLKSVPEPEQTPHPLSLLPLTPEEQTPIAPLIELPVEQPIPPQKMFGYPERHAKVTFGQKTTIELPTIEHSQEPWNPYVDDWCDRDF